MADVVLPDWLDFQPRLFPRGAAGNPAEIRIGLFGRTSSGKFAWLAGHRPVLVDIGFGRDLHSTLGLLPGEPAMLFNTHQRSDHVGGNAGLAQRFRECQSPPR